MPYQQYLSHPKWRALRDKLIKSANFKCQKCGAKTNDLQVHHLHYIKEKKPWEYPNSYLQVLCSKCHAQLHGKSPKYCFICGIEIEDKFDYCYSCKKQHDKEIEDKLKNLEREVHQYKTKLNALDKNSSYDLLQKKLDEIQNQLLKTQEKVSNIQATDKLLDDFNTLKSEIILHIHSPNNPKKISENIGSYNSIKKMGKQQKIGLWSVTLLIVIVISAIGLNRYQNIKNQAYYFNHLKEKFNKQYFFAETTEINSIKLLKISYSFGDKGNIYLFPLYVGRISPGDIIRLPKATISAIKSNFKSRLFFVIGVGSNPESLDAIYIIPIRDLSSNTSSPYEINKYKRKNTDAKFYYDIETDSLK